MTALQSQAMQYQKLMQQQYQQYNKEMIKYQTQFQQWQDKQKTEESNTSLVCIRPQTPTITQQNSYSISHLLDTVIIWWLYSDNILTVVNCQQHGDVAIGSSVMVLSAVIEGCYTVTIQSVQGFNFSICTRRTRFCSVPSWHHLLFGIRLCYCVLFIRYWFIGSRCPLVLVPTNHLLFLLTTYKPEIIMRSTQIQFVTQVNKEDKPGVLI